MLHPRVNSSAFPLLPRVRDLSFLVLHSGLKNMCGVGDYRVNK